MLGIGGWMWLALGLIMSAVGCRVEGLGFRV